MKFGAPAPGLTLFPGGVEHWSKEITAAEMVLCARRAEELGYDFLAVPWHMAIHEEWVPTMGPRWAHAIAATGFLVGATSRITVLCFVVVPCHHPVELAKALATLDFVSGGRLVVVPLVGYLPWEFELLDVPFAERGALMDEYLAAMLELWTADAPAFAGRYVSFERIAFEPKPVQRPLPLWFGAHSKPALRRIARYGAGWMSNPLPRSELPWMLDYVRSQPEFAERPRELEVYAYLWEGRKDSLTHEVLERPVVSLAKDAILEQVAELARVGVTATSADLGGGAFAGADSPQPRSLAEHLERLEWFAEEVLPEARGVRSPDA
jgi:probable F420-dependent oxidoreductase